MQNFLHSNPGLKSRFTRFIKFSDYTVPDLCRIFDGFCQAAEYKLTPEACARTYLLFADEYSRRDDRFGNARFVRNVYEQVIGQHSHRLAQTSDVIDKTALITLDGKDVPSHTPEEFDLRTVRLDDSRWETICPGCGNASKAGLKYLGQKVTCKCGQKFIFPWWCPVAGTIEGLPAHLLFEATAENQVGKSV